MALASAFVGVGSAVPPRAAAAEPCWRSVLAEWSAGRIAPTHPLACYRLALENAPTDVRLYSSLEQDLGQALNSAVAMQRRAAEGGTRSPAVSAPPESTPERSGWHLSRLIGAAGALLAAVAAGELLLRRTGRRGLR